MSDSLTLLQPQVLVPLVCVHVCSCNQWPVRVYECTNVTSCYPSGPCIPFVIHSELHYLLRGGRLAPPARGPAAKTYPLLTPADRRAHFYTRLK